MVISAPSHFRTYILAIDIDTENGVGVIAEESVVAILYEVPWRRLER